MIVRREANGETVLIAQTDHSRMVGQFAAHWGNGEFATPRPYESVIRAATFHDFGWLRYETAPLYDPATGETPEFRRAPAGARQLDAYQWCSDELLVDDPYAGLIVSMHRTGLWHGRYGAIRHPPHPIPPKLPQQVEAFIVRNGARQSTAIQKFSAAEIWTNYQLLQVWDQLGLYFSCQDPYRDYIEPVPTNYDDKRFAGIRMTMNPISPSKVAFDPYPFDRRPLHVQLLRRRLPAKGFADEAAFRGAYFRAPLELVEFELI